MNYLEHVAEHIFRLTTTNPDDQILDADRPLYLIYAVLCLAVGQNVTNEMVHDAWVAWRSDVRPEHKSCVPFSALQPEVQELDSEYRDAIKQVAEELAVMRV